MTDSMQVIRDDIAYMRALADEGRRAPLLGGAILIAGGLIFSLTSLAAWAMMAGVVRGTNESFGAIWAAGFVAFLAALFLLIRRYKGQAGASTVNNRAVKAGWSGAGWSIFAFVIACIAASVRLHTAAPMTLIAPFVLAVYGIGWSVASAMSDRLWVIWTAVGSFVGAVVMGLMAGRPEQLLVYAFALLLLAALPGWLLLRQEPPTTV